MAFRKRRDATYVRELPALRRIIPYLMPTRTESMVFFPQRLEVDGLLTWLAETNASRSAEDRLSLFHVFLTAIARTLRLRPEVNRFVAGRRTYQHEEISVSFIVKSSMADEGAETEARLVLTGYETADEVRKRVDALVAHERGPAHDGDDRLVDFFAGWPRPVLTGVARLVRELDYRNLMPPALRESIPLYTSVYLVNAGSIGVDPPFHHLYEHGSASVFVSLGRVARQPVVDDDDNVVVRSCIDLVYTLDERASDGFYFARSAEVFRRLVTDPALLADPGLTADQIVPLWPPRR